jgi:hypothetical protein
MFADFLLDNINLVRKLEDELKNPKGGCVDVLKELDREPRGGLSPFVPSAILTSVPSEQPEYWPVQSPTVCAVCEHG